MDYLKAKSKINTMVSGDKYRFTVITPRLLRLEYSPNGHFEDRPTQYVVNRDFCDADFSVNKTEKSLIIETEYLRLIYKYGSFSGKNLKICCGKKGRFYDWCFGEETETLPGTCRTLDRVNGETELSKSVLSTKNVGMIDDSKTVVITDDGWIEQRAKGIIDMYVFTYADDYIQAVKDYTALTGGVPLLPRYTLGNWWSRYHKYTQQEYISLMERFKSENIPFSVAVIDMDWHYVDIDPKYGTGWTGYTWNEELFPNYRTFLKYLHEQDLEVTLNLHPKEGVASHEAAYKDFAEFMGVEDEEKIDFNITDRKFLEGYFEFLHHPLEEDGVSFWWLDWQQGTETEIAGLDPLWMLNHYHFLDSKRNGKRPLIFSRYAGVGSQRYPIGFSGDTVATWESLDFQPYFTASASNVGYGWWSHDIGGHMEGYRDDEMVARWVQLGVFSPIMRLHSAVSPFNGKEPWNYGEVEGKAIVDFLRLRHKLIPYIYTMNYRAYKENIPLVTPMYWYEEYEIQNRNQYFFGSSMLVAPITKKNSPVLKMGETKVYLPNGLWYDFFTGKEYIGEREYRVYRKISQMPVFVKAGTIIPLSHNTDNSTINPLELDVYIFLGADGEFTMYEDDGVSVDYLNGIFAETKFVLKDKTLTISSDDSPIIPNDRNFNLIFKNAKRKSDNEEFVVSVQAKRGSMLKFELDGIEKREDDYKTDIFNVLFNAQCEYLLKENIYKKVKDSQNPVTLISDISALDTDEALKGAVLEHIIRIMKV